MIRVGSEQESRGGWRFEVYLGAGGGVAGSGEEAKREVTLSWADYELWSHGVHSPARVIEALFLFLEGRDGLTRVGERFDAARVRRLFPDVDRELPQML